MTPMRKQSHCKCSIKCIVPYREKPHTQKSHHEKKIPASQFYVTSRSLNIRLRVCVQKSAVNAGAAAGYAMLRAQREEKTTHKDYTRIGSNVPTIQIGVHRSPLDIEATAECSRSSRVQRRMQTSSDLNCSTWNANTAMREAKTHMAD